MIDQYKTQLMSKAKEVSKLANVHLSQYSVGAAILSSNGDIAVGCNIEFDNYSNTIHAEESAISTFISSGFKEPIAICVYTNDDSPQFPCGMCRQSLFEFGGRELIIIASNQSTSIKKSIKELLPFAFELRTLKNY